MDDQRLDEAQEGKAAITSLRTVSRIVDLIQLAARNRAGFTASDVARELDMPVSSAHLLVRRFAELECLQPGPEPRRYVPGPRLIRLALEIVAGLNILGISRPHMVEMAAETGEDVYLALADHRGVVLAERVEGSMSLRLAISLGVPSPLHATAAGKLYLASLSNDELEAVLERLPLEQYTSKTIGNEQSLRAAIARIRRTGFAISDSEHIEGLSAIATPIVDASGRLVAALTVPVPVARLRANRDSLIEQSQATAQKISRSLGWKPAA